MAVPVLKVDAQIFHRLALELFHQAGEDTGGQLEVTVADVRGAALPVFAAAPPSMREYFAFMFMQQAPREFLIYGDERLTFGEVYACGIEMAAMLQHRHGIAKGDRVAIAMRNYPEWITAFIAILHLGAVAVPMNAWWTADELDYGLKDSGARLVFADEEPDFLRDV